MGFIFDFKWISAAVILVTTFMGSCGPLCVKTPSWASRAEALAGGVFLGAGLAHLLDDSMEELEKYSYPIGPATALGMFVLLTLVELFSYSEHDADAFGDADFNKIAHSGFEPVDDRSLTSMTSLLDHQENTNSLQFFGTDNNSLSVSTISLYIIMDIHSIIEGLALGILGSKSGVIAIFCAIVGHKPVEAFALSLIIFKEKPTKTLFWILIAIYNICSPIGIIAAIYIGEISSDLAKGLIAAVSAGTFLFVGCHEWSEMFEHKNEWPCKEKTWHFMMFAIGVIWMLGIAIVEVLGDK